MKKVLLCVFLFSAYLFSQNIWINEIHYDNSSTDVNEFIEIILDSTANDTLSNYEISLYRDTGTIYDQGTLDEYQLGSTDSTFKIFYLIYPVNGIQNGPADGMCLSYKGTVISGQFLSYEGTLTATEGPANGMTSTDIGVTEIGSPIGHSLQLTGTGTEYSSFSWQEPREESPGFINADQYLRPAEIEPEPTNHVTNFKVDTVTNSSATLTWTGSVGDQLPHKYLLMAKLAEASFPEVRDSVVIDNDSDWSDGIVAQNLFHADGDNEYIFSGLQELTEYHFIIYPYTNTQTDINYKTDGAIPSDMATTTILPITAISEVRQNLGDLMGSEVKITGTVTAIQSGQGFFMQDKAQPWSGIYVYDYDYVDSVAVSDSIIVIGTVGEYHNLSQLTRLTYFNKIEQNLPSPAPFRLLTGDFSNEEYEGLLVSAMNATCTNPNAGSGNWEVNDGSGVCLVGDWLYSFIPTSEEIYNIIGVGNQYDDIRTIEPRDESDIMKVTTAPIITHIGFSARVPAADVDFIDSVMVTSKFEIDTVILLYTINRGDYRGILMTTAGNDSTFAATIPASAYNDGDAVEFWTFATNTNSDTTRSNKQGFFAGTTGLLSLKQIDENKELVYNGLYARSTGVATVANGVLHKDHLSVNIQDAGYGAIRVFQYDAADRVITPGHSYTVVGELYQHNGLNQLIPDDPDADVIDNGEGIMPEPFAIDLITLLSGPEAFESVLIKIESADTLGDGDKWPGASQSATLLITDDNGATELDLRIEYSTDIGGNNEPVWPQNVTGVFSQYDYSAPYDGGYQLQPRAMSDFSDAVGIKVDEASILPSKLALHNAYPNPFNPSTTISYDIPADLTDPGAVSLSIYNMLGQKIKTLQPAVSAGQHKVMWYGKSNNGAVVASGIYFVVFRAEEKMFSKKILLVK